MDRIALQEKINMIWSKYKYVLLVLALGIFFMLLPEPKEEVAHSPLVTAAPAPESVSDRLEEILNQIQGVGKVRVMLTESAGAQTVYQTDRDEERTDTSTSVRVETVIVSDQNRVQNGLVKSVTPPTYLGAIVVCQGGDQPSVRLAVSQAVSNVTGLGIDRITVLKMK